MRILLAARQLVARTGEHRLVVTTCGGDHPPGPRRCADDVGATAVPVASP